MIAGIDVGATNTRLAVADEDGCIVAETRAGTTDFSDPPGFVAWTAERIQRLAPGKAPRCVGIATPGPLDPRRGVVINPPNLVGWEDVPVTAMLGAALRCPVHLENDANVAALGEFRAGAGRGTRNMVYVTWSTGVGAGLILDGRLFSGSNGVAGEIGHTVLDPNGPLDSCGQRGCVEVFCGGRALEMQTGRSADALFAAAAAGDPEAGPVVERAATYMGHALVNLTNLFDPDMIVLGGGVTRSWSHIEPVLLGVLRASPFIQEARRPSLRRAELGDQAGLVGAVEWARVNL